MKLTAEQSIIRQHVWLMHNPKYALWSGILKLGSTEVMDEGVPTACTNGRDVAYGRAFIDGLTQQCQRGVILHENLHKGLRQLTTWAALFKEWPQGANMAADFCINIIITDTDPHAKDVALPAGGLLDDKYRGMDTGAIFRALKAEAKATGHINVKTVGDQTGKSVPVKQGAGGSPGLDDHDWEGAEALSDTERHALEKEIDRALRQGALLAGKLGGEVPRSVKDILESKVDWREALREFVSSFCAEREMSTWRRPSRRWISQDIYMPSSISETVGRMVIAVDTSGSIDDAAVGVFLGSVAKICETVRPEGIDLLYWDNRVRHHETYTPEQFDGLVKSTRPKGGGGTTPQCIPDYLNANKIKPECCVVLSDGYVDGWGTGWSSPVLWGMTSNVVAKVGKTVRIDV